MIGFSRATVPKDILTNIEVKKLLFIALTASSLTLGAVARPMRFIQGGGAYIVAKGEITGNTPAEFGRLAASPGTALYFDSPGGNLAAALTLGRMIRRPGLNTYVAPAGNGCYSACVYAFSGGVVRIYDGAKPLGVHQFHGPGDQSSTQATMAFLAVYLDEMGVDHRLWEAASLVKPDEIQPIPVEVAREWRLDNSRASVTNARASAGTGGGICFICGRNAPPWANKLFKTNSTDFSIRARTQA